MPPDPTGTAKSRATPRAAPAARPGDPPAKPAAKPRRGSAIAGFGARFVAAEAVRRALREHRALDEALLFAAASADPLSTADWGLARAIATVTFRRMGTIRAAMLARLNDGQWPEVGILPAAMMTGAAQALFMDVPDHAAIDLAIELIKADRQALHYSALANAVLRRIVADKAEILASSDAFLMDMPEWLRARWSAAYGEAEARRIAEAHRLQPHIDLTATGDPAALAAATGGRLLPSGSVRLVDEGAIQTLPGFKEGNFFVQDAASALPARLIGARPGMRIADLCAAPGGKTAQLAAAGAAVTAVERSAQRMARLTDNLARLKLPAELVVADAASFAAEPFDAVLLDAPCSATGTIRRHPEIAWTKRLEDVLALARQQERLLANAATLVKPGGLLVYSTCSLEPEEGERQITRFLGANPGFAVERADARALGIEAGAVSPEGWLRILPSQAADLGGMDGFFAAGLRRSA